MRLIPLEAYQGAEDIELRLAPIDVGFDLRLQGMAVCVPDNARDASYEDAEGNLVVVEGN